MDDRSGFVLGIRLPGLGADLGPLVRRLGEVACRDGQDRRVDKGRDKYRGSTVGDGNSLVEVAQPGGAVRAPRGARHDDS